MRNSGSHNDCICNVIVNIYKFTLDYQRDLISEGIQVTGHVRHRSSNFFHFPLSFSKCNPQHSCSFYLRVFLGLDFLMRWCWRVLSWWLVLGESCVWQWPWTLEWSWSLVTELTHDSGLPWWWDHDQHLLLSIWTMLTIISQRFIIVSSINHVPLN